MRNLIFLKNNTSKVAGVAPISNSKFVTVVTDDVAKHGIPAKVYSAIWIEGAKDGERDGVVLEFENKTAFDLADVIKRLKSIALQGRVLADFYDGPMPATFCPSRVGVASKETEIGFSGEAAYLYAAARELYKDEKLNVTAVVYQTEDGINVRAVANPAIHDNLDLWQEKVGAVAGAQGFKLSFDGTYAEVV